MIPTKLEDSSNMFQEDMALYGLKKIKAMPEENCGRCKYWVRFPRHSTPWRGPVNMCGELDIETKKTFGCTKWKGKE